MITFACFSRVCVTALRESIKRLTYGDHIIMLMKQNS